MFDLRKSPVARILIPFALGAVTGNELVYPGHLYALVIICVMIWIVIFLLYLRHRQGFGTVNIIFAILIFILYLAMGIGNGIITKPKDPGLPVEENVIILGEVLEEPFPGKRNWVVELRLDMVIDRDGPKCTRTYLKVYMEMPDDSILPASAEKWKLYGRLSPIKNNGNPGEPDYESIMNRRNCWYRFFVSPGNPVNGRFGDTTGRRIRAVNIRKSVSKTWSGDPAVVSLMKAVCLGDRSGLTDDMRQIYSAAGGMHLLAVSGLHVGLIWWFLQHALVWMVRLLRKEFFRALVIICLLWFYAFITGFSSSVCRSVTMFTFFSLARIIDQRTHPVNGILVSAFVLIFINPGKILDVGFQLSYASILGIAAIYPKLRNLLKVKNKLLKWGWEATTVSLAAQLSTAPLVVYYFHQLPAYSLLTNLFAIPLLSCLIGLFVISVPFITVGVLTGFFNGMLIQVGSIMNRSMEIVASIPGSVIGDLYLDQVSLIILMILGFMGILMLSYRAPFPKYGILFMVSLWLLWTSWTNFNRLHTAELVVSHFNGGSLVTFREGCQVDHYQWFRDSSVSSNMDRFKSTTWDNRRYEVHSFENSESTNLNGRISGCQQVVPGLWALGNDRISGWVIADWICEEVLDIVLDQPGEFLLLSCEPQIDVAFVYEDRSSCDLIVDGSNRNWFVGRMEPGERPFHITGKQGAYMKRW